MCRRCLTGRVLCGNHDFQVSHLNRLVQVRRYNPMVVNLKAICAHVIAGFALLAPLWLSTSIRASEPHPTPSELFHLRNLCSNAAQRAFQARWSHPHRGITLLGFTNHYSVRTNRCYLLVTYRQGRLTWFDASDAQTGKVAAHIQVPSTESQGSNQQ